MLKNCKNIVISVTVKWFYINHRGFGIFTSEVD
jgi:hypothetical protein